MYYAEDHKDPQEKGPHLPIFKLEEDVVLAVEMFRRQIPQIHRTVTQQVNRRLQIDGRQIIDFASLNYLGFDYHPEIIKAIPEMIDAWGVHPSWTRAVASPAPYCELEEKLACLVGAPSTFVLPNVSMINAGVLPLLAGPDGVIIADYAAHHTVHEACELARAKGTTYIKFGHNNLEDLENQLRQNQHKPRIIVALDGVYSMTAEYVNLPAYSELAKKYNAVLFVDDAHGFGVIGESPTQERPYGNKGSGIVKYYGMDYEKDRIIYVAGLSKAYSSYAAFITCFNEEMRLVLQTSSPYIFSGPVPTATLASSLAGLRVNEKEGEAIRDRLYRLTKKFVTEARALGFEVDNNTYFPIVFVVIGKLEDTIKASQIAWEHGLIFTPGVFPAAPANRGGLRFSVTAVNTETEIDSAIRALEEIRKTILGKKSST